MNHNKRINHLSRKTAHRKALMKNLSNALIEHKRIFTTLAKAKALRRFVEPLVTRAKSNTTHNRRIVFKHLQSKESVNELFSTIAEAVGNRPGGYTRVLRTGHRNGDAADMAMIELVDFNDVMKKMDQKVGRKKTRRSGSSSGSSAGASAAASNSEEE